MREHGCDVVVDHVSSENELCHKVSGVSAILCLLTDSVSAKVMDAAGSSLRVISIMAAGYDNIDTAAAKQRGVWVTNTPGVLTHTVAEHALAMMLALSCRVVEGDRFVREGKFKGWDPMLLQGTDLAGKTVGLIGAGRIGQTFARMACAGLGMQALYFSLSGRKIAFEQEIGSAARDPRVIEYTSKENLLKNSDVVVLFVPLTPLTRHLIGSKEFALMKRTSFLVNMARGPVVDEQALVEALKTGNIRGAALDVYENEPELMPGLAELPNVVLAPHTGSASEETRSRMSEIAAQNIIAVLEGEMPRFCVVRPGAHGDVAPAPKHDKIFCFSDGASRGNPGKAGGGVLIYSEDGSILAEDKIYFGVATNNEAEYRSLLHALNLAVQFTNSQIICTLDSELVVKQLNKEYKIESDNLRRYYDQVLALAQNFKKIEFRHQPRTEQNLKKVDKLANQAIDSQKQ